MTEIVSDEKKDQIKEVINIGASSAATALSTMINNTEVKMSVPEIIIEKVENVSRDFGDVEKLTTVILLKTSGDLNGIIFLIFEPDEALRLAGMLTHQHDKELNVLDDMDRSALKEAGNILSGASLAALAKFINLNINHSIPEVATDMLGALVNSIVAEFGYADDDILMFKVGFAIKDKSVKGNFYFLFDAPSTQKIISATSQKVTNNE